MMEKIIKNELQKNNVKDNRSGLLDKITFRYFSGEKELGLNTALNGSYGYISVSLSNATAFSISLNGVIIFRANEQNTTIIPIRFCVGDVLKLNGVCSDLKILVSGAEFEYFEKNFILYPSNKFVLDCGGIKRIYSISSLTSESSSYTLDEEVECMEMISFKYNNCNYFARLICENDGVYLCTSMDNYATKTLINFDYDNLIIVGGNNANMLGIVYNLGSNLCVRWVNSSLSIGGENIIESVPEGFKDIKNIRVDDKSVAFAVSLFAGNTIVYYYTTRFIKILNIKSRKEQFCIVGGKLYNSYLDGYGICIKKYSINLSTSVLTLVSINKVDMADCVLIGSEGVKIEYNLIERYSTFANL